MLTTKTMELPVRPRVLIADDSRIVRATLIKHIEGMFDFREALDGEQAWEALLLDQSIRVVITDLTMPKLDGYGLLKRIRESKVSRIRNIPVVVVSGSDEQEERDRAKAAGATDLITKGIGTAQLLSRLDILSKLVSTQYEFERGLEALVQHAHGDAHLPLASPGMLDAQAATMLANAIRQGRNFVLLNAGVGLRGASPDDRPALPPASVVDAIGQLLRRTVRQTDCVSQTGAAEFTFATGNIHFDSARNFAQRICGAIANADLVQDVRMSFVASCGMVALAEFGNDTTTMDFSVATLREIAVRRAQMGLHQGTTGVVGPEEEAAFHAGAALTSAAQSGTSSDSPDLSTLLNWVKEGKKDLVLQHIGKHGAELRPLLDLLLQQPKGG
jgi:two-component system, cell cycle response regulator